MKIDLIPYRGAAPALQDILGGHVDLFFATPQSVVQQVKAGKMKVYGITSKEKSPELPNGRKLRRSSSGPSSKSCIWHALFAPAGTPDAVINKLNAAVQEIVSDPAVAKIWAKDGVVALSEGPALAGGGARHAQERDRALGPGDPRQQYSSAAVAAQHSPSLRLSGRAQRGSPRP